MTASLSGSLVLSAIIGLSGAVAITTQEPVTYAPPEMPYMTMPAHVTNSRDGGRQADPETPREFESLRSSSYLARICEVIRPFLCSLWPDAGCL